MCGITGIYNYHSREPIQKLVLSSMCEIIRHRGPDDEGIYINDEHYIGLGQRRLSIIDLLTGHQPMSNKNETIWVTFNGEIYNYLELKRELLEKGYSFITTSDTEVIIYLFQEYGERAFEKLNGIFAFALYDLRSRVLYLVRDHFGVKPLYYFVGKNGLIFGSEIKTILLHPDYEKEIDRFALDSFLTFRYNPSPQTLFKGIKKLSPGYFLRAQIDNKSELHSYWNYEPATNITITKEEAIEEYQRLLEQAIKRQLISDVSVGLLLSGGIDSAVIAKVMAMNCNHRINTYTIGFEGKGDFNELVDAEETAKLIEAEHHSLIISKNEYLNFFYCSFLYTEEPISETTIPALYYVCRLASKDLKVVLAGQGADEPLAGYKRYLGEKYISKYSTALKYIPEGLINNYLPRNERIKRAIYASQFSNELERFLAVYTIFSPSDKEKLYKNYEQNEFVNYDLGLIKKLYDKTHNFSDALNKLLFIDTRLSLSDDLLLFGDKMSMANSLEMRVPYLDVDLVSFLETLPSSFKLHGITNKYIHKKALKKWLPEKIIDRKKRGFATPMDEWLRNGFSNEVKNILMGKDSFVLNIFQKQAIQNLIDDHESKMQNNMRKLYSLLSLEVWYKNFFENKQLDPFYNVFNTK